MLAGYETGGAEEQGNIRKTRNRGAEQQRNRRNSRPFDIDGEWVVWVI